MNTSQPDSGHPDALALAEHIIEEYAADLIGSASEAFASVLPQLVPDGVGRSNGLPRQSLARMRGPYLQALPAPLWSDETWLSFAHRVRGPLAAHGFKPELVDVLQRRGFRRLYRYQQQGMESILHDRDVLITAATGRGKTETWLLPILQYILMVKDGDLPAEPVSGTKALLLYPTKALAQDQLRRLIQYLVPLNRQRPPDKRITLGIFDGDTPSGTEPADKDYLFQAFRLFDCPVAPEERCTACPHNLVVVPRDPGARLTLALPERQCEERVPLDFVVLTRRDMVRAAPDILITNPDMLHLRLLNVNDREWRSRLITEPRFLVIDEIHTYAETFGANVSWVMRRLRAARHAVDPDRPLRIIAASATVGNGRDLFTRIAGLDPATITLVSEESATWTDQPAPEAIPDVFLKQRWSDRPPRDWFSDPVLSAALGGRLTTPMHDLAASEALYERLSTMDGSQLPTGLSLVRWLYGLLRAHPRTPHEIQDVILTTYPHLTDEGVQILVANTLAVATAAGILESRAHLFCWPIDGYYLCVSCRSIYLEPQARCRCGQSFVTRLAVCTKGDELSAEGWFCPLCTSIYPLLATVDGQFVAYEPYQCAAGHTKTRCIRLVWRPYGHCPTCGRLGKQGDECVAKDGVVTGPGDSVVRRCTTCGATSDDQTCSCGGIPMWVMHLPWVCTRCGTPQATGRVAPLTCETCGHNVLLLGGLLDVPEANHCDTCDVTLLPGHACAHEGHALVLSTERAGQYSLVDRFGRLYQPSKYRNVVPCYHPRATYAVHSRYTALMRSPANVAVTSSQIALRRLVSSGQGLDDEMKLAKLLSFSDSQSDMEELARDFNDPEVDTFIDQAIFHALSLGPSPLDEVIKAVADAVPQDQRSRKELQRPRLDYRITGRFISGRYPGYLARATLTAQGLVDLVWRRDPPDPDTASVLAALIEDNGQPTYRLQNELQWTAERLSSALTLLNSNGWTNETRGFIRLQLTHLSARRVGPTAPIHRTSNGRFILTALHQLDPRDRTTLYRVGAEERTLPSHADYSRIARRIFSTDAPVILEGKTYKGSTPKEQRRKLEYMFANRPHPNLLSSGPAMEVGIDIGDLDRVLLYGTPPNINGYLQRIGRAGRRSKQALVVSVSKRNPIDLYYYRDPLRLIQSQSQPVPLQEHNERIIDVMLTMAILDFVATRFTIPWSVSGEDSERHLECEGEPIRLGTHAGSAVKGATWLNILRLRLEQVEVTALTSLEDLVQVHALEVEEYLRGLLAYRLCTRCGQQVPEGAHICPRPGCGGPAEVAADRYADLIEAALSGFAERIVSAPFSVVQQYRPLERKLAERKLAIDDEMDSVRPRDRGPLLQQLRQLDAQLETVLQAKRQAQASTLWDNQERSAYARYSYGLRGGDDEVAVELVKDNAFDPSTIFTTRDLGPALREYAPGALTLHDTDEYVTLAVLPNTARTDELRRLLVELQWPDARACSHCALIVDGDQATPCPSCGQATSPVERLVPGRVRAYRRDEPLQDDPRDTKRKLYPSHAFPLGDHDTALERTFVHGSTRILSFRVQRRARIVDGSGHERGQVSIGSIELLNSSDSITASYTSGEREVRPRLFQLCGEPGCGGLIAPSTGGIGGFCMIDPTHDTSRRRLVQVDARLSTVGLQVTGLSDVAMHSFLHGLRAGLEKVAGVLVRSVGEHLADGVGYLYDVAPGGAGITELLLDPAGNFANFDVAIDVATVLAECACDDGCPQCLYQYGCATRNMPTSLSRRALKLVVDEQLRLEEITTEVRNVASSSL